jgi:hypothetical protein
VGRVRGWWLLLLHLRLRLLLLLLLRVMGLKMRVLSDLVQ